MEFDNAGVKSKKVLGLLATKLVHQLNINRLVLIILLDRAHHASDTTKMRVIEEKMLPYLEKEFFIINYKTGCEIKTKKKRFSIIVLVPNWFI